MKVELFPFQKKALRNLRDQTASALRDYQHTHAAQVVSFTAPTGAGKTIIMASLIESVFFGDEIYPEQQDAIFVWLSDSPQLNEQSKLKIDLKSDRIRLGQCVTIEDDSFDQETFSGGHVYFLNTQKLGKSSNLTKAGDRNYTIWETLANTVNEKSNRLYFVIDEAHRGMQGKEAGRATTIMQRFLKGYEEENLPQMPVVIGMSATMERFNKLVEGTTSTTRKCVVTPDEVRSSGLLKDRIVITYPEDSMVGNEMAILQAAADDWKEKWEHWTQYCQEQHHAYVNPVFVIQVQSAKGDKISDTDLDVCLQKIEERTGFHFDAGEVVHTFGQTSSSSIVVNGLEVHYEEPSRISDNKKIKVVFFKENLSTGWDCPRAETMMSFRRAVDSTYIAQLLGRMVRTPMQMHINVDDVLNDVHLYLPHFDEHTVKQVVDALQSAEGGEIPAEIYGETQEEKIFATLTVRPRSQEQQQEQQEQQEQQHEKSTVAVSEQSATGDTEEVKTLDNTYNDSTESQTTKSQPAQNVSSRVIAQKVRKVVGPSFDREAVIKFINDAGLLSYNVRSVKINNYLTSLFKMVHFLSQYELYPTAVKDVTSDIVQMICKHAEDLKEQGKYEELASQVRQFKLKTQIFDVFGKSVDNYFVHDLFTSTDEDIERQFRIVDSKLGHEGIGNEYGRCYYDEHDPSSFKIDVILFAVDEQCSEELDKYAKEKFHTLNDEYRRRIANKESDKIHRQYDNIVSDGDPVSKHNFRLPEIIQVRRDRDGKEYSDHLFVEDTGTARIKLNSWEEATLEEERRREDFVCWIRNPSRGSWALTIPYEDTRGQKKPTYPDLIIIRKDEPQGYIVDILEPHNPTYDDNLGKARGFAEYARQNPGLGRIQLIRMVNDRPKRLDMSKSDVREEVLKATTPGELNNLFDRYGRSE